MAVLNAGKIEQIGRPQDLYRRPDNVFVAQFMGETNFLEGTYLGGSDIPPMANQPEEILLSGIDTPIGRIITTAAPPGLSEGQKVTLSIRPESFNIGVHADGGFPNLFPATVHDTIYLGEMAQHQLTITRDGRSTTLKAFEMNPKIVARDDARQEALAFIDPRDVIVFKR